MTALKAGDRIEMLDEWLLRSFGEKPAPANRGTVQRVSGDGETVFVRFDGPGQGQIAPYPSHLVRLLEPAS